MERETVGNKIKRIGKPPEKRKKKTKKRKPVAKGAKEIHTPSLTVAHPQKKNT